VLRFSAWQKLLLHRIDVVVQYSKVKVFSDLWDCSNV